jgi:hypothetical protein
MEDLAGKIYRSESRRNIVSFTDRVKGTDTLDDYINDNVDRFSSQMRREDALRTAAVQSNDSGTEPGENLIVALTEYVTDGEKTGYDSSDQSVSAPGNPEHDSTNIVDSAREMIATKGTSELKEVLSNVGENRVDDDMYVTNVSSDDDSTASVTVGDRRVEVFPIDEAILADARKGAGEKKSRIRAEIDRLKEDSEPIAAPSRKNTHPRVVKKVTVSAASRVPNNTEIMRMEGEITGIEKFIADIGGARSYGSDGDDEATTNGPDETDVFSVIPGANKSRRVLSSVDAPNPIDDDAHAWKRVPFWDFRRHVKKGDLKALVLGGKYTMDQVKILVRAANLAAIFSRAPSSEEQIKMLTDMVERKESPSITPTEMDVFFASEWTGVERVGNAGSGSVTGTPVRLGWKNFVDCHSSVKMAISDDIPAVVADNLMRSTTDKKTGEKNYSTMRRVAFYAKKSLSHIDKLIILANRTKAIFVKYTWDIMNPSGASISDTCDLTRYPKSIHDGSLYPENDELDNDDYSVTTVDAQLPVPPTGTIVGPSPPPVPHSESVESVESVEPPKPSKDALPSIFSSAPEPVRSVFSKGSISSKRKNMTGGRTAKAPKSPKNGGFLKGILKKISTCGCDKNNKNNKNKSRRQKVRKFTVRKRKNVVGRRTTYRKKIPVGGKKINRRTRVRFTVKTRK